MHRDRWLEHFYCKTGDLEWKINTSFFLVAYIYNNTLRSSTHYFLTPWVFVFDVDTSQMWLPLAWPQVTWHRIVDAYNTANGEWSRTYACWLGYQRQMTLYWPYLVRFHIRTSWRFVIFPAMIVRMCTLSYYHHQTGIIKVWIINHCSELLLWRCLVNKLR